MVSVDVFQIDEHIAVLRWSATHSQKSYKIHDVVEYIEMVTVRAVTDRHASQGEKLLGSLTGFSFHRYSQNGSIDSPATNLMSERFIRNKDL